MFQNVGDKVAKYLDKKCRQFYSEQGYSESDIDHFMVSCELQVMVKLYWLGTR